MLTETYDNRRRQELRSLGIGHSHQVKRGAFYRTGTDTKGRPIEVTLPAIEFRVVE